MDATQPDPPADHDPGSWGRPVSALPRGQCPECGADVALRKGGLVREHRGGCQPIRDGYLCGAPCPGSGEPALPRYAAAAEPAKRPRGWRREERAS
jgi:hypothetical protein